MTFFITGDTNCYDLLVICMINYMPSIVHCAIYGISLLACDVIKDIIILISMLVKCDVRFILDDQHKVFYDPYKLRLSYIP